MFRSNNVHPSLPLRFSGIIVVLTLSVQLALSCSCVQARGQSGDSGNERPAGNSELLSIKTEKQDDGQNSSRARMSLSKVRRREKLFSEFNKHPHKAQALLERSELLVEEGYLQAAIESYQELDKVLAQTPAESLGSTYLRRLAESPGRIWLSIAGLYVSLDKREPAVRSYNKALNLAKDDYQLRVLCARGLAELGEFERALKIANELGKEYSTRLAAGKLLVWIRNKQGQPEQAEQDLQEWRQHYHGDGNVVIVLASYYSHSGQTEKAKEILTEQVKSKRRFLPSYRALAELELEQGRKAQAVKWLAKMVRARRSSIVDAQWLILDIAKDHEQAGTLLRELRVEPGLSRDFALAWAVGTLAEAAQMPEQAALYYRGAINLHPGFDKLYLYLIRLQLRHGQADQSLGVIAEAQKATQVSPELYQLEGLAHLIKDDPDSAIICLEAAIGAEASDTAGREVLAAALLEVGRADEAIKHLQILANENPDDQSLQRQLILAYLADGRTERALEIVEKVMASHRLDEQTALTAAQAFLEGGQANRAVEVLEGLSVSGEHAFLWQNLFIEALVGSSKISRAQNELGAWLEQTDNARQRRDLASRMAGLLARIGETSTAIELALAEMKNDTGNAPLLEVLIQALLEEKDYEQAHKILLERTDQEQEQTIERLRAMIFLGEGNYEQAEQMLHVLIGKNPRGTASLHLLARIYEQTARSEQANRQYERILQIDPKDIWANNNLGYAMCQANERLRLEEAEEMIRLALRQGPTEASIVDSMGWVLYKLGRFGQAYIYLSRAVRLADEPQVELIDHLGDTFYRLHESAKAVEAWKKAVKVAQSSEEVNRAQVKRLQNKLNLIKLGQVPAVAHSVMSRSKAKHSVTDAREKP